MAEPLLLTSARLFCTQIKEDDWDFYRYLLTSAEVQFYVSDIAPEQVIRDKFSAKLPVWLPQSAHWLSLVVREKSSGKRLGITGYIHREADCAELGFLFAPDAQGKGFAQESLKTVCDYAFTAGGITRLIATVTAGNMPSRKLLEKMAFRLQEQRQNAFWLRNSWHHEWIFTLLRDDNYA